MYIMSILSAENCLILIGSSLSKHPLIHKNQSRVHRERRRLVCTQFGLGGWRQFCENANPMHTPQPTETITKSMRRNEKHIAYRSFDILLEYIEWLCLTGNNPFILLFHCLCYLHAMQLFLASLSSHDDACDTAEI